MRWLDHLLSVCMISYYIPLCARRVSGPCGAMTVKTQEALCEGLMHEHCFLSREVPWICTVEPDLWVPRGV